MEKEELDELLEAARDAVSFLCSIDGYENGKTVKRLVAAISKVEDKKLLTIGRLAARVVYRNARKAVEHSVQRTGFACDVDGCKKPGVVHLCEDHGLQ